MVSTDKLVLIPELFLPHSHRLFLFNLMSVYLFEIPFYFNGVPVLLCIIIFTVEQHPSLSSLYNEDDES